MALAPLFLSLAVAASAAVLAFTLPPLPFKAPRALLLRLGRRGRSRSESRQCLADLPTLVDALVLGVEAGQSLYPAFLETRQLLPPGSPLFREIDRMEENVRLGLPQTEALEEMGRRLPERRAQAFLDTLGQALRLGTPIARVLKEQSRLAREHLLLEAEQHANTLAIRLLLPLFLFILPAAFLLIISPVLLTVLENRPW